MAKTKAQKGQIIDTLADSFKSAATTVFVHFRGVNVTDETAMRRALGNADVKYTVAKKTLIRLALQKLGVDWIREAPARYAGLVARGCAFIERIEVSAIGEPAPAD